MSGGDSNWPGLVYTKMERAKGYEPSYDLEEVVDAQVVKALHEIMESRIGSHLSGSDRRDLARIVASWPKLHAAVKSAILAMVISVGS